MTSGHSRSEFPVRTKGAWPNESRPKGEEPINLHKLAVHMLGITCSFAYAESTSILWLIWLLLREN